MAICASCAIGRRSAQGGFIKAKHSVIASSLSIQQRRILGRVRWPEAAVPLEPVSDALQVDKREGNGREELFVRVDEFTTCGALAVMIEGEAR